MKKQITLAAAFFTLLLMVGCASVQTAPKSGLSGIDLASSGSTVAHINATYEGWYFLCFPLITGTPTGIVFGEDTCNVNTCANAVTAEAKKLGASKTINMVSTRSSGVFLPIPLLFRWNTAIVSADAIR